MRFKAKNVSHLPSWENGRGLFFHQTETDVGSRRDDGVVLTVGDTAAMAAGIPASTTDDVVVSCGRTLRISLLFGLVIIVPVGAVFPHIAAHVI